MIIILQPKNMNIPRSNLHTLDWWPKPIIPAKDAGGINKGSKHQSSLKLWQHHYGSVSYVSILHVWIFWVAKLAMAYENQHVWG